MMRVRALRFRFSHKMVFFSCDVDGGRLKLAIAEYEQTARRFIMSLLNESTFLMVQ